LRLIVGLGNPGEKYARTRHNMGYMAVDMLHKKAGSPAWKWRFEADCCKIELGSQRAVLLKPLTYMNNSGRAVKAAARWFRAKPEEILVIYDDIDIPESALRIRKSGSAGTHNGMRSVIEHLGTEAFARIRIGIGKPPAVMELADYVLSAPPSAQLQNLLLTAGQAAEAAAEFIQNGIEAAMGKYNKK